LEYPITFMPLPRNFDHHSARAWALLVHRIQSWMCTVTTDRTHPQWQWGLELFWISFVAAYPEFPAGCNWPSWSSDIPLDGSFINSWI
ncbi:hypothetical protein BC835DRAFT_1247909, partial [Cytidiella melzeri]